VFHASTLAEIPNGCQGKFSGEPFCASSAFYLLSDVKETEMNIRKPGGSGKAFTLIELLVVIGIVAVIAAILFPVFAGIRERGRRTQCLSNERQLGMAIMQYAADNDERLFVAWTDPRGPAALGPGLGWAGRCYPYVKTVAVFRCPDDATTDIPAGSDGSIGGWAMYAVSYGFNSNLAGVKITPFTSSTPPMALGQIDIPSRTVLLFEVNNIIAAITDPDTDGQSAWGKAQPWQLSSSCGHVGSLVDCTMPGGYSGADGLLPLYATGNMGGIILNGATINGVVQPGENGSDPRHGAGANYVACDGHVVWLRPEQVSPGDPAKAESDPQLVTSAAGTANPKYALTFSNK
jgi:prepilin-type N-terminal cleavage/methylation domain-containing protein/prepilin-type processing-associated H-X9-DG protein